MELPIYQVDAFTSSLFAGNPAAVVPLPRWLPEGTLQAIAAENNLSETAFVVPEGEGLRIRWFTPLCEVRLCGHATLAAAWVWLHQIEPQRREVVFDSLSGPLTVTRNGEWLTLDFPAQPVRPIATPVSLSEALGVAPSATFAAADDWVALFDDQEIVRTLQPQMPLLKSLECRGLIVTAPGEDCDFVSRFFGPRVGVEEDPVTGSAHTKLVPFWAGRLGKGRLHARQLSRRGGELWCEERGDRVAMSGHAVLYLRGTILLDGEGG